MNTKSNLRADRRETTFYVHGRKDHLMNHVRSHLLLALMLLVPAVFAVAQTTRNVPGTYATIQAAVNAAVDGDIIAIAAGTYNESVSVTKGLTFDGAGAGSTIIDPSSGSGFQVNAAGKDVTFSDLTVTGATDEGINVAAAANLTISNVTSSNNGSGSDGSGVNVVNVTGSTSISNLTASGNKRHGLSIGSSDVAVSGGTFNGNGVAGDLATGSGILVKSESGALSNVSIDGVTANGNTSAGINVYATGTGTVSNVDIGQTTIVNLTDNGSNVAPGPGGAAVLIYGAVDGTTITANATSTGAVTKDAGLVVVGTDEFGANSPTNTVVLNSNITGYTGSNHLAGTMYVTDGTSTRIGVNNVDAVTNNMINGVTTGFAVEDALQHKVDNATLGLFRGPGTELYVTPSSGSIQRAIDIANNPYTVTQINIQDGTYAENVTVNKAVVLNGQGANTKIQPSSGNGIADVTVAGVTLQNVHIYLNSAFAPTQAPTATNNTFTFPVKVKAFLGGAFSGGTMTTAINSILPLSQPYNVAPFNYAGTENVASVPANATDWILVELRETSNGSAVAQRAVFLQNDGQTLETDGNVGFSVTTTKASGYDLSYFVVLKHRNHLAVMSAAAVSLPNEASAYDFTTAQAQAFGTSPMAALAGGVFGLVAGDGGVDGFVTTADFSPWLTAFRAGSTGYVSTDYNLDGNVTTGDFSIWLPNFRSGAATQVP